MKYINLIFLSLVFVNLNACTKSQNTSLISSEKLNENGIRGDVADYIQKRFPKSEKRRAALTQFAKDYQEAFEAISDPKALSSVLDKIELTIICIDAVFGYELQTEVPSLLAQIMNNRERSVAGIKVDGLLYDHTIPWPSEDMRINKCRFDVSKMRN